MGSGPLRFNIRVESGSSTLFLNKAERRLRVDNTVSSTKPIWRAPSMPTNLSCIAIWPLAETQFHGNFADELRAMQSPEPSIWESTETQAGRRPVSDGRLVGALKSCHM